MTAAANDQDRDCAVMARTALFPPRIHRDVAHAANHFPALLVLERFRSQLQRQSGNTLSSNRLFPPHVVVVRNVAAGSHNNNNTNEEELQWNGHPDIHWNDASFTVIPDVVSVRCTSECHKLTLFLSQKAVLLQKPPAPPSNEPAVGGSSVQHSQPAPPPPFEIVLCTDRVLQSDYTQPLTNTKDVPAPRSWQAVQEAVAHQLAKVQYATATPAVQEVQAAQAAECYYHDNNNTLSSKTRARRQIMGSQLSAWGHVWYGSRHNVYRCVRRVAVQNLVQGTNMSRAEAAEAVHQVLDPPDR